MYLCHSASTLYGRTVQGMPEFLSVICFALSFLPARVGSYDPRSGCHTHRDLASQTVFIPEWSFSIYFMGPISIVISVLTVILCSFQHLLKHFIETQTQANDLHSKSMRSRVSHFQFCNYYLFISFLKNQQTYVKFSTSNNIIISLPVGFLLHTTNQKQLFHFYNYFKYVLECVYMCFICLPLATIELIVNYSGI